MVIIGHYDPPKIYYTLIMYTAKALHLCNIAKKSPKNTH